MPSPINVIINAASGTSDKEDERRILADIFKANGIDANIELAKSGN